MKRELFGAMGIAALVFAGCGGGGGTTSVPAAKPVTAPASPASTGTATAQISVHIPAKSMTSSTVRKPAYISSNTGSVSFSNSGTTTVVALTTSSGSCTSDGMGGYNCTAQAKISAGTNQQITVSTFASTDGSGTPLSTNVITQTITANQVNPLSVTLNGVVSSFGVAYSGTEFTVGTPGTVTATVTPKDASGAAIVGSGSLVDSGNNPVTVSFTSDDTSGAISITGPVSGVYTINYTGAAAKSPTFTAAASGATSAQQVVRVNLVTDGGFTLAATATNAVGGSWYSCGVPHAALAAPVAASPAPSPAAQATGAAADPSPLPLPTTGSAATPVAQLATTAPTGSVGTPAGNYTSYAMVNSAYPQPHPTAYKGSVGICQDITIPAGSPSLNVQFMEGSDDNFVNSDVEADLVATPAVVTTPHPDGTIITTPLLATLFAEQDCWDSAGWELIFTNWNGGTGSTTPAATSRFAACPETVGGPAVPYGTGIGKGGTWIAKSVPIPAGETGGTFTLFLGTWRNAGSGTPTSSSAAYYTWALFTGVGIY